MNVRAGKVAARDGAKAQSVTLHGQKVPYHLVTTPRGNAVEVLAKAPAAEQTLAVQTAG